MVFLCAKVTRYRKSELPAALEVKMGKIQTIKICYRYLIEKHVICWGASVLILLFTQFLQGHIVVIFKIFMHACANF